MRVAVLGAPGARGRRVVRDLLDRPEITNVVLVGSPERDLARLVAALDPLRVSAASAPLTVEGIAEAISGLDVAFECLEGAQPAEFELTALMAAIAAQVPFVSGSEVPETVESMLSTEAGKDVVAVAGLSWAPGVSNVLVRVGAELFDTVTAVRIAWCTSRHDEGADGMERLGWAWALDPHVLEGGNAVAVSDDAARGERVFFPEPVGWQRVHPVRGAELLSVPKLLPGLESMIVEGGLSGGPSATLARAVARRTRTLNRPAVALAPKGIGWSALRVDVTGRTGGAARTATYGLVDHLPNLQTAPLVVGGLMVARGEVEAGGVMAPEVAFDPDRFLSLLAERGVRVARLER